MSYDIHCPAGGINADCNGPVTFELGGIQPENIMCREEAKRLFEENPHAFAGLLPIDLTKVEDTVIDLRIRNATAKAIKDLRGPAVGTFAGLRLVQSED